MQVSTLALWRETQPISFKACRDPNLLRGVFHCTEDCPTLGFPPLPLLQILFSRLHRTLHHVLHSVMHNLHWSTTSSFGCCVFHHILCTLSRFISVDSTWPSCSEARPQKCNNLFIRIFEWGQYIIQICVARKGVKTILHHLTHFLLAWNFCLVQYISVVINIYFTHDVWVYNNNINRRLLCFRQLFSRLPPCPNPSRLYYGCPATSSQWAEHCHYVTFTMQMHAVYTHYTYKFKCKYKHKGIYWWKLCNIFNRRISSNRAHSCVSGDVERVWLSVFALYMPWYWYN